MTNKARPTDPPGRGHADPERGQRIADARDRKRLTQNLLGQRIGCTDKAVSGWEHGKKMSAQNLLRLAAALDVTADFIEYGTPQPPAEIVESEPLERIEDRLGELVDHLDTIDDRLAKLEVQRAATAPRDLDETLSLLLDTVQILRDQMPRLGRDIGLRDLEWHPTMGRRGPGHEDVA